MLLMIFWLSVVFIVGNSLWDNWRIYSCWDNIWG